MKLVFLRNAAGLILATTLLACIGGNDGAGPADSTSVYLVEGGNTIIKYDLVAHIKSDVLAVGSEVKRLRISPDGTHLLYVQNDVLRKLTIATKVTQTFSGYKAGDWSGDGSKIFVASDGDNIYSMNPDGTGASAVLASGAGIESIDIDKSGTKMLVVWSKFGWQQVVHLTTGGTLVATLTATGVASFDARWSGNGSMVVYDRDNTLWTNSATGSAATEEPVISSVSFPACPSFTVEDSVFFVRQGDLWAASPNGSNQVMVYNNAEMLTWPEDASTGS